MNQTFQIRRFSLLLRLYFEENGRWYLTKLAVFFVIIGAFLSTLKSSQSYQVWFFLFIAVMIGMNSTDTTANLANYNEKNGKGMRYLLLPASNAEKLLVSFTINFVFCMLNIVFVIVMKELSTYYPQSFLGISMGGIKQKGVLVYYFFVISIFVFGSILFVKLSSIKSILLLFVFFKIPSLYQYFCSKIFASTSNSIEYYFYRSWAVSKTLSKEVGYFQETRFDYVYLLDDYPDLVPMLYLFVLIGAIWYASFLRLRETEI